MRRCALLLTLLMLVGCVRNPATGKRQFSLVSRAQEVELGQQARQEIHDTVGLVQDPSLQAWVSDIGLRLVREAGVQDLYPWSFGVVDDDAVNAFALPGGPIFVTRGMLAFVGSEAELAAVLAHEIGHVAARHGAQQLSRAQLAQAGLGLGAVLLGEDRQAVAGLAGVGLSLLLLRHSRDAEREADTLGLKYLVDARYEPDAMVDMFALLSRLPAGDERGRLPGWLQTHPEPKERLEATAQRVAKLPPIDGTTGRDIYLSRVEGLEYGPSPRQGFFEGQRFVHPVLGIQFTFPEGFQTQNMPEAVVGVAERRDVALVLGVAPADTRTPEAAVQRFARQPGLEVTGVAPRTLGGSPGVSASFLARADRTIVEGVVSFVQQGGRVYQLVGYAPQGSLARNISAIERAFESFAPLPPEQRTLTAPYRLEITRVPEPMTLAQFYERFPSALPLPEIARLNALQPDAQLQPGQQLKRVVPANAVAPPQSWRLKTAPSPGRISWAPRAATEPPDERPLTR